MAPVERASFRIQTPWRRAASAIAGIAWRSLPHLFSFGLLLATVCLSALIARLAHASVPGQNGPIPTKYASSAIAITMGGDLLVVANPDSNSVTVIRTDDLTVLHEIAVGKRPVSIALSPSGNSAFVSNYGSNSVSQLDIVAGVELRTVAVGDRPAGVALSPDGRVLAIAEYGADQLRWMDADTLHTLSVARVDDRPYGVAITPDGHRVLVTHLLDGAVTVLDARPHLAYLPFVAPATGAGSLESSGDSSTESPRRIATWPNVAPSPAVVIDGDGHRAYLPQTMANGAGLNTRFDTTVFPKVSVIDLDREEHRTSEHISLPETDRPVGLPWDVALAKDGTELWVVNSASNDVSVIDISTQSQPVGVANVPVQDNPRGIAISPDGGTAYVNNTLAGTVSVIDTFSYSVTTVVTATTIPLPPDLLRGKRLFFSSARTDLARSNWISCNTCHIENEQDGRTWQLRYTGEVPPGAQAIILRNTTSLLGMVETYPLRWSGEWDESADSEFSVRFEQYGSGLIQGDMHATLGAPNQGRSYDLDCLAAYIDGLSLPPRAHTLGESEQRGKAIFESQQTGCADCHPAPLYTDLQRHDVGTAGGPGEWFGPDIDTPTLRFAYDSAPYLHDGRAPSLYDVLSTHNAGDLHGATSHLDSQELQDLMAFLLALPYVESDHVRASVR